MYFLEIFREFAVRLEHNAFQISWQSDEIAWVISEKHAAQKWQFLSDFYYSYLFPIYLNTYVMGP